MSSWPMRCWTPCPSAAALLAGNAHVKRDIAVPWWLRGSGEQWVSVGYLEAPAAPDADRWYDAVHQFPAVEREDPCAAFARRPADRRSVRQRAQPHPQRLQPLLVTAPAIHVAGVDRLGALVVAVGRRRAAVPVHVADARLRRQVAERQHLGHDLLRVLDQLLVAHIEDPLWIQRAPVRHQRAIAAEPVRHL